MDDRRGVLGPFVHLDHAFCGLEVLNIYYVGWSYQLYMDTRMSLLSLQDQDAPVAVVNLHRKIAVAWHITIDVSSIEDTANPASTL